MSAPSPQPAGQVTSLAGRIVSGWVPAPPSPPTAPVLALFINGAAIGTTAANLFGDPVDRLTFEFLLPANLPEAEPLDLSVSLDGAFIPLANPTLTLGPAPDPAMPELQGYLEPVTAKGTVKGWARYPAFPNERVELEILVDDHPAGTTRAVAYRADVAGNGQGDGRSGFSWPLPYLVLAEAEDVTISVRDKKTGAILPEPRPYRQAFTSEALRKIAALEADIAALRAQAAARTAHHSADAFAAAELFQTVGSFFGTLANAARHGDSPGAQLPLAAAIDDILSRFPPLALPACAAPALSIFVDGTGPLPLIHETLTSLAASLGALPAAIFLLDTGANPQAALLPLAIHNLRYARAPDPFAARVNAAMRLSPAPLALFIQSGATLAPGWPEALPLFAQDQLLGLLAGRITAPDGTLESAGLALPSEGPHPRGAGAPADDPAFTTLHAVPAPAPELFALRHTAWASIGGLDESFTAPGYAIAGFSLRLTAAGSSIIYHPALAATLAPQPLTPPNVSQTLADIARLRALRLELDKA